MPRSAGAKGSPKACTATGRREFLEAGKRRLAGDTACSDHRRGESAAPRVLHAERGRRGAGARTAPLKKHDRGCERPRMRCPASEKLEITRLVELSPLPVRRALRHLGVPPATSSSAGTKPRRAASCSTTTTCPASLRRGSRPSPTTTATVTPREPEQSHAADVRFGKGQAILRERERMRRCGASPHRGNRRNAVRAGPAAREDQRLKTRRGCLGMGRVDGRWRGRRRRAACVAQRGRGFVGHRAAAFTARRERAAT